MRRICKARRISLLKFFHPARRSRDQRLKRDVYERTGVQEYWLVDPDGDAIEVLVRAGDGFAQPRRFSRGEMLTTRLLPGLELPLDKILG